MLNLQTLYVAILVPASHLLTVLQIGQVKEKIAAEKGWEASTQKLIYSGICYKTKRFDSVLTSP